MTSVTAAIGMFIATWIATGWFVSRLSGWSILAQYYRTTEHSPPGAQRMKSGVMRKGMRYNNALTIGAEPRGLYVAMPALFRIGHPRLLIPWSDISTQPRQGFFGPWIRFAFRSAPGVYLDLKETLGREMLSARR